LQSQTIKHLTSLRVSESTDKGTQKIDMLYMKNVTLTFDKTQPLVYYGDKGLSELLGTSNNRRLKAIRDLSVEWIVKGKRQKFPKFPAHIDIIAGQPQYFYIKSEVEQWIILYGQLCDQIKNNKL